MAFLREYYAKAKFITADQLNTIRDGKRLSIAGLVLIRQRPGSAKGVVFITIEDEPGSRTWSSGPTSLGDSARS